MESKHEVVSPSEGLPFKIFLFEGRDGNYQVQKHWHQSVELFLVLEGEIDFYLEGNKYPLKENEFILVNSNEIHSIEAFKPNFTIVLQIPTKLFGRYVEDGYIQFRQDTYGSHPRIQHLLCSMYEHYEMHQEGSEFLVLSDFYSLQHLLIKESYVKEVDQLQKKKNRRLRKLSIITEYIEEHYAQDISLEDVASEFGYSYSYLSRLFQKYANLNYRTYLQNVRLEAAYQQLVTTSLPLHTIAQACGFSDSRALAKVFVKRYGILPSEYRTKTSK